jgi:hypothetical protein
MSDCHGRISAVGATVDESGRGEANLLRCFSGLAQPRNLRGRRLRTEASEASCSSVWLPRAVRFGK